MGVGVVSGEKCKSLLLEGEGQDEGSIIKTLARSLRKNQTDAERKLWSALRNRQIKNAKFRRQFVIEPYIVDFVCLDSKLIVELDGGQHAEQIDRDAARTEFLNKRGFKVLRFWNNEVFSEFNCVIEQIYSCL